MASHFAFNPVAVLLLLLTEESRYIEHFLRLLLSPPFASPFQRAAESNRLRSSLLSLSPSPGLSSQGSKFCLLGRPSVHPINSVSILNMTSCSLVNQQSCTKSCHFTGYKDDSESIQKASIHLERKLTKESHPK